MKKLTKKEYLRKFRKRTELLAKKRWQPEKSGVFKSSGRTGSLSCFKSSWKEDEQ